MPSNSSSEKYPQLGEDLIYSWVRALEDQNIEFSLPLETIMELTKGEIKKVYWHTEDDLDKFNKHTIAKQIING